MTLRNLAASVASGIWPKIALAVFAIELAFLFLGSTIPLSQSTINQIASQNSGLAQTSDSLGLLARAVFIFSNNFRLGALQFIPFFGWLNYVSSMYGTAVSIEVIGIVQGTPGPLVMLSLLFEPHTWLELPAYAIATTQSFFFVSTIARPRWFKFEVARTFFVFGIVAVELFIAALFESAEISFLSNGLMTDLAIMWTVFAMLVALLFIGRHYILKGYRAAARELPLPPPWPGQQQQMINQWSPATFCTHCGSRISEPQVAMFCAQCGARLSRETG